MRIDEKLFFTILLGLPPFWDYKPINTIYAVSSGVYTNDKILNSSTINKIHLKCDVIDGTIQNGLRHSIMFSFVLDKKPGYKISCEP